VRQNRSQSQGHQELQEPQSRTPFSLPLPIPKWHHGRYHYRYLPPPLTQIISHHANGAILPSAANGGNRTNSVGKAKILRDNFFFAASATLTQAGTPARSTPVGTPSPSAATPPPATSTTSASPLRGEIIAAQLKPMFLCHFSQMA
jgi:hypothetical protein